MILNLFSWVIFFRFIHFHLLKLQSLARKMQDQKIVKHIRYLPMSRKIQQSLSSNKKILGIKREKQPAQFWPQLINQSIFYWYKKIPVVSWAPCKEPHRPGHSRQSGRGGPCAQTVGRTGTSPRRKRTKLRHCANNTREEKN